MPTYAELSIGVGSRPLVLPEGLTWPLNSLGLVSRCSERFFEDNDKTSAMVTKILLAQIIVSSIVLS